MGLLTPSRGREAKRSVPSIYPRCRDSDGRTRPRCKFLWLRMCSRMRYNTRGIGREACLCAAVQKLIDISFFLCSRLETRDWRLERERGRRDASHRIASAPSEILAEAQASRRVYEYWPGELPLLAHLGDDISGICLSLSLSLSLSLEPSARDTSPREKASINPTIYAVAPARLPPSARLITLGDVI